MSEFTDAVTNLVHEPTQTEGRGIDLTVTAVYEITAPGRVDFGGSELAPADVRPRDTSRRNPEDEYEWWHLTDGQYLLAYNESLADGWVATVQTREELRERGAFHPTLETRSLGHVPLSVGGAGIRLKENARVSTVVAVDRAQSAT